MSPVSRGRKTKKTRHSQRGADGRSHGTATVALAQGERPAHTAMSRLIQLSERLSGPRPRPPWFDRSIDVVLGHVGELRAARGPRELEQAVAQQLGAQLYAALNNEGGGLWFDWWFDELADAAIRRLRASQAEPDLWHDHWRLLNAMTSLGRQRHAAALATQLGGVARSTSPALLAAAPPWLSRMRDLTATGDLWLLRDRYGCRFGVIAGFQYPDGLDASVYLFDIDACSFIILVDAGVYDDVAQAARAWRASAGATAAGAEPAPVDDPGALHCLVHWDGDDIYRIYRGDESRVVMDNDFRASGRLSKLAGTLAARGTPLPAAPNPYHGRDAGPLVDRFTAWYTHRYREPPDEEATRALAEDWVTGRLPGTELMIHPRRVRYVWDMQDQDYASDHPITLKVKQLMPDWVRCLGELTGLSPDMIELAVAEAADRPA